MPTGVYKRTVPVWNKGKKYTEEERERMNLKNCCNSGSFKKGHKINLGNKYNLGRHHTKETKEKIGQSNFKNPSKYWLGKKRSKETRKKISKSLMGRFTGVENNLWQGGISIEPYTIDWTETLRRSIRERDRYACQVCRKKQGDKAFDVHHIDYDKKNCNPNNLITLCHSCHTKTNFKRKYWTKYFKLLIKKIYGN